MTNCFPCFLINNISKMPFPCQLTHLRDALSVFHFVFVPFVVVRKNKWQKELKMICSKDKQIIMDLACRRHSEETSISRDMKWDRKQRKRVSEKLRHEKRNIQYFPINKLSLRLMITYSSFGVFFCLFSIDFSFQCSPSHPIIMTPVVIVKSNRNIFSGVN